MLPMCSLTLQTMKTWEVKKVKSNPYEMKIFVRGVDLEGFKSFMFLGVYILFIANNTVIFLFIVVFFF